MSLLAQHAAMIAGGGAPSAGSSWDAALKGSGITLSNGDRDATKVGVGYQSVYGVQGRSSGYRQFQVYVVARPTISSIMIGIADKTNPAAMITSYIGNNSGPVEAIGLNDNPTRYFQRMTVGNNNGQGAFAQYGPGYTVTVGVDFAASTVRFLVNGAPALSFGIPITSGKTYFPAASVQSDAVVRIGTTGLIYPLSGASDWD